MGAFPLPCLWSSPTVIKGHIPVCVCVQGAESGLRRPPGFWQSLALEWFIIQPQGSLCRRVCEGKISPLLLSQHSRCNGLRLHHRRRELQRGIYSQLQQWFNSEPHHVGVITHCVWAASHAGKAICRAAWALCRQPGPTPAAVCERGTAGSAGGAAAGAAVHAHRGRGPELSLVPVQPTATPGSNKHLQTPGRT